MTVEVMRGRDAEEYLEWLETAQLGERAIEPETTEAEEFKPASGAHNVGVFYRSALVLPKTLDVDKRTVDVIFTTGAEIERGMFYKWSETLGLKDGEVRLDWINSGRAPVLDAHNRYSSVAQLGVVEANSARIVRSGSKRFGIATLRLRQNLEGMEAFIADLADGTVGHNISQGYKVFTMRDVTAKGDEYQRRRAIDWEPWEISFVPIPADQGSQTRAARDQYVCSVVVDTDTRGLSMPDKDPQNTAPGAPPDAMNGNTGGNGGTATPPAPAPTERSAPAPGSAAPPDGTAAAQLEERARCSGIMLAVRAARLPDETAETWINEGISLGTAQTRALEHVAQRSAESAVDSPRVDPVAGGDGYEKSIRAMQLSLEHRSGASGELPEEARPFRGMSLLRIAEELVTRSGGRLMTHHPDDIVDAAFNVHSGLVTRAPGMATSDFSNLLANVAGKKLRMSYDNAPKTWLPIARRNDANDFKTQSRVQLGEGTSLETIPETGEYPYGTIGESAESYGLQTHGKIFGFTRQAIINDDTSAFDRLPRQLGNLAAQKESDLVWALFTGNPTMGDGVTLFHANHGNTDTQKPDYDALSTMREKMRLQTGIDSQELNIVPQWIITPCRWETMFKNLLGPGSLVDGTVGGGASYNQWSSAFQGIIVEPRLDAHQVNYWYAAASPDQIDVIEYGYLAGNSGPAIFAKDGWLIDGVEFKIRHDFAAAPLDWRGLFRSTGTT